VANLIVAIDDVQAPSSTRNRPTLALRGSRRKMVKKLMHYVQVVLKQDAAEDVRGTANGYSGYMFTKAAGSSLETKLMAIETRCVEVLADRLS
jgi:hypothetical protein